MQKQSSNKTFLIGGVVVVILIGGYFYMSGKPKNFDTGIETATVGAVSPEVAQKATKILSLLRQVKSLDIDEKFFTSAVYTSLMDYSVEVPPQNVGKQNPFYVRPVAQPTPTSNSR